MSNVIKQNRPRLKFNRGLSRYCSISQKLRSRGNCFPQEDYFFLVAVFLAGAAFGEGLAAGFLVAVFLAAMEWLLLLVFQANKRSVRAGNTVTLAHD